jgi:hypothetical protein
MSISPNRAFDPNPATPIQSDTDPWTAQVWNVAAVSKDLNELYVNGQPPQFRLVRRGDQPPLYALKPVTPVELPDCLAPSVMLTQVGSIVPDRPRCVTNLLPYPFTDTHDAYWNVLEEVIGDDRDLKRLEGTIRLSDGLHKIRLYRLDSVLADQKSMLVVDIEQLDSITNSDGTAIGHN